MLIKFSVTSTIIVLLQFKKRNEKLKKTHYLINDESDQKSDTNKKNSKFYSLSDMFYQISVITNNIV